MLGLIFRGVFLIGVLTWYSTNVWKMIDGYFRDQFRSYLEEEYRKNPRMKSDLTADSAGSVAPVSTTPRPAATVPPPQEIPEGSASDDAVEAAENDSASIAAKEKEEVTGGSSENEDAWGTTDKNAFLGTAAESGLESRKSPESELESRRPINHGDRDPEEESHGDGHRSVASGSKSPARRIKLDKKSTAPRDILRGHLLPRAGTLKTIIFTEKDYKQIKKNDFSKDDFWEFEEDALEKEPSEGILVSELPFKPRLDIGDLERVTADEYCPLTLEDEASCEETVKWP